MLNTPQVVKEIAVTMMMQIFLLGLIQPSWTQHLLEYEILKPELTQIYSPLFNQNQLENNISVEIHDSVMNSHKLLENQSSLLKIPNHVMHLEIKVSVMNSHKSLLMDKQYCPLENPKQVLYDVE